MELYLMSDHSSPIAYKGRNDALLYLIDLIDTLFSPIKYAWLSTAFTWIMYTWLYDGIDRDWDTVSIRFDE